MMKLILISFLLRNVVLCNAQIMDTQILYFNNTFSQVQNKNDAAYYSSVRIEKVKKGEYVSHYEVYSIKGNLIYFTDADEVLAGKDSVITYYFNEMINKVYHYNAIIEMIQEDSYLDGKINKVITYKNGQRDSLYEYEAGGILNVSHFEGLFQKQDYTLDANRMKTVYTISATDSTERSAGGSAFNITEKMPEYPGGVNAMYQYLGQNVKYPKGARDADIQGKVYIAFVVNETGTVDLFEIKKGVHPLLDFESLRVMNTMPAWNPAMQNGKAVRVAYTLPVAYRLDKK